MSIIPFLVKRGLSQNLPESLMEGELAVTTDTHKLYVGTGESRVLLNPDSQASETAQRLETARNITLSGKVNGQTSFDGSKNVTIDTDLSEDVKQQLQKLD